MRKRQSSILIKVIFGILLLVMVGFGVQYAGVEGNPAETVAEVNSQPIYRQQLQRSVSRMVESYRNIYKEGFSAEMLAALKFKDQALDDLIRVSLLRQEAERLGLEVIDEEVRDAIAMVPAFQADGRFSFDLYSRVLRSNGLKPADFEAMQREDLMVRKLQDLLVSGVYVSDAEVKQQFQFDNEQVSLRFVQVKAADLEGQVQLSDEQLQAYYDANKEAFREPEKVRAELVTYSPSAYVDKVVVEDAEVEEYFKNNTAEFEGKTIDDVRAEIQISLRETKAVAEARRAARADHEKAVNGEALAALAGASGATRTEVGPLARTDALPGAGRVPALTREMFLLEAGQLGDLVETERDTYMVRVTEKVPSRLPDLAEVRDRVAAEARREEATKKARERATAVLAKLRENAEIAAAAEGLEVRESEPFRRLDGLIPGLGPQPDLRVEAFKLTKDKPLAPEVYEVDGDVVVALLKDKLPADDSAFEAQKDSIRAQIDDRRKRLVVEEFLKQLRARAQIRINPEALDRVYVS